MAPLTRTLWRVAPLLSVLLLLPLLLIRAQPNDDNDLRTFLTPSEGCPAPCFMGIRPDVTTWSDLMNILSQHPWVEPGSYDPVRRSANVITWDWTQRAPSWIDRRGHGIVGMSAGQVRTMIVTTTLTWGDFVLSFGLPDNKPLPVTSDFEYKEKGWYADWGILLISSNRCWVRAYYDWPVRLQFQTHPPDYLSPASVSSMPLCR